MKTTEEMIAVMQAYADGKKIEVYNGMWVETDNPHWEWESYDYRVKEEPKYRPYKDAEECFNDVIKHGGWMKEKSTGNLSMIVEVYDSVSGVVACIMYKSLTGEELLTEYTWADDGSPCGVKEE